MIKHWILGVKMWYQLSYHIQMNHWRAAFNICRRIDRLKMDKLHIKLFI